MTHTHWIVQAYKSFSGDHMDDVTTLDVVAEDLDEAMKRVNDLFPLKYKGTVESGAGYRVQAVLDYSAECGHEGKNR